LPLYFDRDVGECAEAAEQRLVIGRAALPFGRDRNDDTEMAGTEPPQV
jgi:hypothetical protein